jgi:thymidylate synthase (FAD)
MTSLMVPSQRLFGVIVTNALRGTSAPPCRVPPCGVPPLSGSADTLALRTDRGGPARHHRDGPDRHVQERPVPDIVPLKVQAIAWTHFEPPADVPWETDADGGEALAEFAGRACYQSWKKPNPATATNAGYLQHILEVGHLSVLEHGSVTFYLSGISRSLTHELIRHRHFSYSQLSQRYVPERDAAMVEPDVIAEDPELHAKFLAASEAAVAAYTELLEGLEKKFADVEHATLRRKQARQAARALLPNATETRIVVTGNYRAWRHFIAMRASEHADVEIRALAIACLRELKRIAGNAFADFQISSLPDGTEVASSPMVSEG